MSSIHARFRIPALSVLALLAAAVAGAQPHAEPTAREPIPLYVFAEATNDADAAAGLADSVRDFKTAATARHAETFTLVEGQEKAQLTIEIRKRNRELFGRDVWLVVQRRHCAPELVYRGITGGRFTDLAHATLGLVGTWWKENLAAAPAANPPGCGTPLNVFLDVRDLRIAMPAVRANAAWRLGAQGQRASAAVPDLVALLADMTKVRQYNLDTKKDAGSTVIGIVAAQALARVEGLDRLHEVMTSDPRERARINAANALRTLVASQSDEALRTAARNDKSAKVRKAVEKLLATPAKPL